MHDGAVNHGHGMVGRMTSTNGGRYGYTISWLTSLKLRKHTEAECPSDEKQGREGNEEWSGGSCEPVTATFDAFETSKDEAGAGTGHDDVVLMCEFAAGGGAIYAVGPQTPVIKGWRRSVAVEMAGESKDWFLRGRSSFRFGPCLAGRVSAEFQWQWRAWLALGEQEHTCHHAGQLHALKRPALPRRDQVHPNPSRRHDHFFSHRTRPVCPQPQNLRAWRFQGARGFPVQRKLARMVLERNRVFPWCVIASSPLPESLTSGSGHSESAEIHKASVTPRESFLHLM
jgi:hypothetical protein